MHEYRLCEHHPQGIISFMGAYALCRVVKRNEHLHQGEDKVKWVLPFVTSESNKRKHNSKVLSNSLAGNSSPVASLLDLSSVPFNSIMFNEMEVELISAMVDVSQTEFHSDASAAITLEGNISEHNFPTQFPSSTESCLTNGMSPVSSFSNLTEAFSIEQADRNCFSSICPNSLHSINIYNNEGSLPMQNLEWVADYCVLPRSSGIIEPLDRQTSGDEQNLWSQEDGLMFVV